MLFTVLEFIWPANPSEYFIVMFVESVSILQSSQNKGCKLFLLFKIYYSDNAWLIVHTIMLHML